MARTKMLNDDDVTTERPVQIPAPDLQVIQRGLENVFGLPSEPIKLKDPQFATHWVNTGLRDSRFREMTEKGYLPVRPEYLEDPKAFLFSVSVDGYVTKGNRGEEILMYSTKENVRKRAYRKAEINSRGMRNAKQEAVEAAGQQLGDEAASFLQQKGSVVGGVRDSYERIQKTGDEQE
jgi:hypothetical protein